MAKKKKQFLSLLLDTMIFRSWWAILLTSITIMGFTKIWSSQDKQYEHLKKNLFTMAEQKNQKLLDQEYLQYQIDSQRDPEWVNLVLRKELGVVPEGQIKVHFFKEE